MVSLTIKRLDARYHSVRSGEAEALDLALSRLVERDLPEAVTHMRLPTHYEICIPHLHVEVAVADPGDLRKTARAWANELLNALEASVSAPTGTVIYRTKIDALVDLVKSIRRGDIRRLWAWKQVGIVSQNVSRPSDEHVTRALAVHPELVSGALQQLIDTPSVGLSAIQWLQLAHEIDRFLGPIAGVAGATAAPSGLRGRSSLEDWLGNQMPWDVADGQGQRRLARLVLLCSSPEDSSNPAVVQGVVNRWAAGPFRSDAKAMDLPSTDESSNPAGTDGNQASHRYLDPEVSGSTPRFSDAPITDVVQGVVNRWAPGPFRSDAKAMDLPSTDESSNPAGTDGNQASHRYLDPEHQASDLEPQRAEQTGVASSFGGVVFAVHCLRSIGLLRRIPDAALGMDASPALAHVLATASGADIRDPAVRLISGMAPEEVTDRDLRSGTIEILESWSDEVVHWHRDRLDPEGEDDLAWFWRRRAEIRSEPGWIDVNLPQDSVDLRIRRAGLDIDPGFVWWLGAVVRYSYV